MRAGHRMSRFIAETWRYFSWKPPLPVFSMGRCKADNYYLIASLVLSYMPIGDIIKEFEEVVKQEKSVALLTEEQSTDLASCRQPDNNGWRRISMAVDSGACKTVASIWNVFYDGLRNPKTSTRNFDKASCLNFAGVHLSIRASQIFCGRIL